MGKTIKTGGVGKNPAIEKMKRLHAISSRMDAAGRLEQEVFAKAEGNRGESMERMKRIADAFSIDFQRKR